MKFAIAALTALFAVAAHATSPMTGLHLTKTVGQPSEDAVWQRCLVRAKSVTITAHDENADPKEVTVVREIALNEKNLLKKIRSAAKAKTTEALHIRETVPNVKIEAGIFPELSSFVLSFDGASMITRTGRPAAQLVTLVNDQCGNMIPVPQEEPPVRRAR